MSDDAPSPPRKMTVEDLVIAQQKTQKALEDVVDRLDLLVDREVYVDAPPSGNLMAFRVFAMIVLLLCWAASASMGPTPLLVFISLILLVWIDSFFDMSTSSAREQDRQRKVRQYWAAKDKESRERSAAQPRF